VAAPIAGEMTRYMARYTAPRAEERQRVAARAEGRR
jgi:hypothetical protein